MNLTQILSTYSYLFVLIMLRYIGLFLLAPILASRSFPLRVKLGFILFLSILTLPILQGEALTVMPQQPVLVFLDVLIELSIGFTIGFIAYLVFTAIQLAGQFIDLKMGFAIVNVIDPLTGVSAPMMGQFKNILAVLLFLSLNGHHQLIKALYQSFKLIPRANFQLSPQGLQFIFRASADIFIIAFQLALPIVGTLFIADVIFGFLARTIPQMNIFIVGLPAKILLGFIILISSIHITIYFMHDIFVDLFRRIVQILSFLG